MNLRISASRSSILLLLFSACASEPIARSAKPAAEPPLILKQPVSQVGKRLGSVTFVVNASGTPPLTYKWFRDGNSWPEWNRSSLTVAALTENDGGVYTVTISNAAGSVTSDPARLTLAGSPVADAKPEAPAQPTKQSALSPPATSAGSAPAQAAKVSIEYADVGQSVSWAVTADGSAPFKFQWKKDGQPIAGATKALFAIRNVSAADAGTYMCIVTNAAGSTASEPVKLVVPKP
jgi:hypothetical protein